MASITSSRLALWLEPVSADAAPLSDLMARVQSWAASPSFGVHMTLLSGLTRGGTLTAPEVDQMWEQVLCSLQAWRAGRSNAELAVPLLPPTSRGTYYQSLVFPLEPVEALLDLHSIVRDALALPQREFWPHVSLAYTNLGWQASQLASRLEREGWRSHIPPDGRLVFATISLWSCEGPTEKWNKLHEVQLSNL